MIRRPPKPEVKKYDPREHQYPKKITAPDGSRVRVMNADEEASVMGAKKAEQSPDYDAMNKAELTAAAEAKGIKTDGLSKSDLVAALKA